MRAPNTTQKLTAQEMAINAARNLVKIIHTIGEVLATLVIGILAMLGNIITQLAWWYVEATGGGKVLVKGRQSLAMVILSTVLLAAAFYSSYKWGLVTNTLVGAQIPASLNLSPVVISALGWGSGVLGSFMTSIVQARYLRGNQLALRQAALNAVMQKRVDTAQVEGMVDIAKIRAIDYNSSDMRKYRVDGMIAAASWGLEFYMVTIGWVWPAAWFSLEMVGSIASALAGVFAVEGIVSVMENAEEVPEIR